MVAYESLDCIIRKLSQILIFLSVARFPPCCRDSLTLLPWLISISFGLVLWLTSYALFTRYILTFVEVSISRENMALEFLTEVFERELSKKIAK